MYLCTVFMYSTNKKIICYQVEFIFTLNVAIIKWNYLCDHAYRLKSPLSILQYPLEEHAQSRQKTQMRTHLLRYREATF